jgi:small GTP-binding protein
MSLNEKHNKRSSEYKLVLFGNTMVGKTTIANRFIYNHFKENVGTTIGAAYGRVVKEDIPLGIWDTAGQERYLSLVGFYHRGADIILMVYDVNDESTIDRLDFYFDKLDDIDDYRLFVIGNKMDLISDNRRDNLKSVYCTFIINIINH